MCWPACQGKFAQAQGQVRVFRRLRVKLGFCAPSNKTQQPRQTHYDLSEVDLHRHWHRHWFQLNAQMTEVSYSAHMCTSTGICQTITLITDYTLNQNCMCAHTVSYWTEPLRSYDHHISSALGARRSTRFHQPSKRFIDARQSRILCTVTNCMHHVIA